MPVDSFRSFLFDPRLDAVLVVPPFASADRPSLGVELLAALARERGFSVEILYANLDFAHRIGPSHYRQLCHTPTGQLVGERIYARAFYGDYDPPDIEVELYQRHRAGPAEFLSAETISAWKDEAEAWVAELAPLLATSAARYVGATTTFEQTMASLAILQAVKRLAPDKVTLLGGANVDGEMAAGIAAIAPAVDVIFAGESEATFLNFLEGGGVSRGIVTGVPLAAMDALPPPDYRSFFGQLDELGGRPDPSEEGPRAAIMIPYESSRGCWWGAKHHCTFCGLNANGMQFRSKSPDKVLTEISALSEAHDVKSILMVDNIMPHDYFTSLLPALIEADKGLSIFYEQKANISRQRMTLLRDAGVQSIQPGIESLSTELLKLMRKGTSATININCLRYARSEGIDVAWNLLVDFPGEAAAPYAEMTQLVPLITHLQPPGGVGGLSIDRFSPYFDDAESLGLRNVRPMASYRDIFPAADLAALAYHFVADYESAARKQPSLVADLKQAVDHWIGAWRSEMPLLLVVALGPGKFLAIDTRECAAESVTDIPLRLAALLLGGARSFSADVKWALDRGFLAEVDGAYAALATADRGCEAWHNHADLKALAG